MIERRFVGCRVEKDGSRQSVGDGSRAIGRGRDQGLGSGESLRKRRFSSKPPSLP